MPKAIWQGQVIAESEHTIELEGNQYFPANAVHQEFLQPSDTHTTCPWKGQASYHHVVVNGQKNPDAAWFYPAPKEAAKQIKDHIAFWKGVQVQH